MTSDTKIQEIARSIAMKRPLWKVQAEDDILTIGTYQMIVEWAILRDIEDHFKVKVRTVTVTGNTVIITINTGNQS